MNVILLSSALLLINSLLTPLDLEHQRFERDDLCYVANEFQLLESLQKPEHNRSLPITKEVCPEKHLE